MLQSRWQSVVRILLVCVFLSHSAFAHDFTCEKWFLELEGSHHMISYGVKRVLTLPPVEMNLQGSPTWDSFDELDRVTREIRDIRANHPNFEEVLKPHLPEIQKSRDKIFATTTRVGSPYQPNQYDLNRALKEKILVLNRELPPELQVIQRTLLPDAQQAKAFKDARKLVSAQSPEFMKLFSTTGFASPEEFEKALVDQSDSVQDKVFDLLSTEKVEIFIRRPERGRFWIPKVGFHNQFVTKSSEGLNSQSTRNIVEATYLGLTLEEYERFSPYLKPKYVTMRAPEAYGWRADHGNYYGQDIYHLSLKRIRDRMTWTVGDSLNRHPRVQVVPRDNWDKFFIPWDNRSLMVPYLTKGVKDNYGFGLSEPMLSGFRTPQWTLGSVYPEIQIFGPLTLHDVIAYEFTRTPPTGDFLDALKLRKLPIIDGRTIPRQPWTP